MRLHRITYSAEGVPRQEFAGSDTDASKRCTEIKKTMSSVLDDKPERAPVDIPTDKAGLLAWLNTNAKLAVE